MNKRLVSGIQPTGELHIGNYIGAIKQWVELQHEHDCFFFVADYHALTTRPKPEEIKESSFHVAAMMLACGIDPKKAVLFMQSDIPEHAELAWIMSSFVSVGELNRMTQFKEKSDRHGANAGLLTYPILMTADVAVYEAELVPVGNDQTQHLELSREIIRAINSHVGDRLFNEPKPIFSHAPRLMALNDPSKKMSKSVSGSAIGLLDDENSIRRTIMKAVTDSDPNSPKMSPAVKNIFNLLEGVSEPETVKRFEEMYREGKLRYSELKEQLFEDVIAFLGPIQKTYYSIIADKKALRLTFEKGGQVARDQAIKKLAAVKKTLGLI